MMRRILQVVWREYRVQTRTKGFVIGTIVAPLFLVVVMFLPALLIEKGANETRCAVLDETGVLFDDLVEATAGSERTSSARSAPASTTPSCAFPPTSSIRAAPRTTPGGWACRPSASTTC
jgi:ABC-type Na+ efflux pump permease subunit